MIDSDYEQTLAELFKKTEDFLGPEIVMAKEEDREEIMALYTAQLGHDYCPWDEDYPSDRTIDYDLSRDALFVLKKGGRILAAISLDEDEKVNSLPCWNKTLVPEGELSRLAVLPEEQNKGLGRAMLRFGMDELKRRGCKGVHFLVNKNNIKAIRSYEVFGCSVVGECRMYDQDFLCYEKEL
ncbi:MAG: GNAT family N-acetyltransferase [Firmicutes bacterium]|nr:GNAT family N-acetyltransferase [Bacillota bacterium]